MSDSGFKVQDRRHWTKDAEGAPSDANGDDGSVSTSFSKPSYVEELEQKLAAKDRELRELVATYKRDVTQTVEDTKQRLKRDAERTLELERARLVETLLPVLDNLVLAINHARKQGDSPLVQGVAMVEKLFIEKLSSLGVERMVSIGQRFDPKLHEAITMVPSTPEQDGVVVGELRPGFRMNDRVIQAALVQVGRAS